MPDLTGLGTSEATWAADSSLAQLPALEWSELSQAARVVVIAPHPDDEVLGLGGVIALLARQRVPVVIVAVTDGERSHPERAEELRVVRDRERARALEELGCLAQVHRLGLPDGGVTAAALRPELARVITSEDAVVAPWEQDGHPDHDACAEAAAGLGRARWSYVVWGWHWCAPEAFPIARARQVRLDDGALAAKQRAVQAFVSQLEGEDPVLPPHVLARFLRPAEVLLEAAP